MFLSPPPGATAISGWALLPLRAFLGFTFCFAGLQKLANPNFFNANSPSGIQAQMIAGIRLSPVHALLGHLLRFSTPLGVLIALGEVAVGLGALLGLWTRLAAIGGVLLSFTLFLTVSFHSSPYYTGADLVFVFAWLPLVLAGSGGVLSLDQVIASWTQREAGHGPPNFVPVAFSRVQEVCGHYHQGACAARNQEPCDIAPCPFLGDRSTLRDNLALDEVDRRRLVLGGAAVGGVAAVSLIGVGAAAGIGRLVGGAKAPSATGTVRLGSSSPTSSPTTTAPIASTTAPTTSAPAGAGTTTPTTATPATSPPTTAAPRPSGTAIGAARDVPVGGAARFNDPTSGDPALVLQPSRGSFVAFDAVCPHAGCTVGFSPAADLLVCPCHGSEFSATTGAVETGPAPTGLAAIRIAEGPDGQLYVGG